MNQLVSPSCFVFGGGEGEGVRSEIGWAGGGGEGRSETRKEQQPAESRWNILSFVSFLLLTWWLVGWLIGWLVGWLVGWLIDWLVGWLVG